MDAGVVDVQSGTAEFEPLLEAKETDATNLGPISPELALVDPVLAERARQLLPEPGWHPRSGVLLADAEPPSVRLAELPGLQAAAAKPVRRRRWPRAVVLAGLVFVAGAGFGGVLGERPSTPSGVVLEVRSPGQVSPSVADRHTSSRTQLPSSGRRSAHRVVGRSRRGSTISAQQQRRRSARLTWAVNVLGVAAQVAGPAVKLVWQRPADSGHVIVVRTLGDQGRSSVAFRGRATSFRDVSLRPCTAYRYTIINYDRRGHRSTGVPTSVVTDGCT